MSAELLYGGKTGAFQFDNIVQLTSKTADGVVSPAWCLHVLPSAQPFVPQPAGKTEDSSASALPAGVQHHHRRQGREA